jgi:hypothetical protein
VVLNYLHQKKAASLAVLRRVLLPTNAGLLLSAIDVLIRRGVLATKPTVGDIVIELSASAQEVRQ